MAKTIDCCIKSPYDSRINYSSNYKCPEKRRIAAVLFENYEIMPSGNDRIEIATFSSTNQAIIIPCRGSGIELIKARRKSKGRLITKLDNWTHIRIKEGNRNYNYLFIFGS